MVNTSLSLQLIVKNSKNKKRDGITFSKGNTERYHDFGND